MLKSTSYMILMLCFCYRQVTTTQIKTNPSAGSLMPFLVNTAIVYLSPKVSFSCFRLFMKDTGREAETQAEGEAGSAGRDR